MKIPKGKRLLIDGDILRYRCAFAAEKTHYLVQSDNHFSEHPTAKEAKGWADMQEGGVIWSRKELQPVEFAYNAINVTLNSFVALFEPSSVDIYLSASPTFRDKIAVTKPYKGNRADTAKPKYYKEVGEYLLSRGAIVRDNLEADDCLAIALTADREGSVILSIDKDLDQVPGLHYNWVNDKLYNVTARQGDFALYSQLLTGDSTDNIPGLPGVGPRGSDKILEGAKSSKDLFQKAFKAYQEAGKSKDYFLEQLSLVYILRKENDHPPLDL